MKFPTSILFICLTIALTLGGVAENPADFTLPSVSEGKAFRLSEHRGKVVVLHFLLKTECPVCLRYTHTYAAAAAKADGQDFINVFVKPDSEAEIQKWAGKISQDGLLNAPVIYRDADAALAKAFGIPDGYRFHGQTVHYPALVALGIDGKEAFRYVGKSNTDRMAVSDFIAKLKQMGSQLKN